MKSSRSTAPAVLVLLATVGGCHEAPPPAEEGPRGQYRYALQMAPGGLRSGTLVVDGKDVGPLVEGQGAVDLPHTEWLGDKRLGLRVETTCGLEEVKLDASLPRSIEIERRRRSQVVAAGVRHVSGVVVKSPELVKSVIYLDARTGPPTDVTIGKQTLPAVKTGKVVVHVGSCAEAKTIAVGGSAIGQLAPADKAVLVDVPGGQCTRLEALRFVTPGMPTRGAPKVELLKGRRTHEVPIEITYFFMPPPASIDGGGEIGKTLWSAGACPGAP